jgi:hypothetical protein
MAPGRRITDMTDNELTNEVRAILQGAARTIPQAHVNRIVLAMLDDIRKKQTEIINAQGEHAKRIKELEDKSLVMFAQRRPAVAVGMGMVLLTLLNAWFVSSWRRPLVQIIGEIVGLDIPEELIP